MRPDREPSASYAHTERSDRLASAQRAAGERSGTLVVLDVGKTNVRLAALDEEGGGVALWARPNRVEPGPPYPHFDVDALFAWLVDGLAAIASSRTVRAIVPVTHGAAAALLAADGLALPVLDYEFDGPASLGARYPRPPFEETLSPPLAAGLNLGRQLFWQRESFPKAFARVERVLPYPQYWAWRLSGTAVSECTSLGCHSDLWKPREQTTSSLAKALDLVGRLPPLARAWQALGPLRPELRSATGLDERCVVLAGIHDSNASFFSHRVARSEPFAVLSTGTWLVAMAHGGSLWGLTEHRDTLANVDAFGAPLPTARFPCGREYAAIAGEDGLGATPDFTRGTDLLRDEPSTASPERRAAQATLHCALRADLCLDWIGARGDLIVEGPLARSDAFGRVLAALRPGQCVLRSSDETGTLGGALALWRHASGVRPSPPPLQPCEPLDLAGLAAHRERWRERSGA